jgi:glycosyl transferase family 87
VTLKRIRAYSIVIAAVLWTMWIADMSTAGAVDRLGKLKGTDFLQFYVGGSFAREGRLRDFYDVRALHARAEALVPESRDIVYVPVQSPQTALLFAPLSALPYVPAVSIWLAAIVALYAWSCWTLWRRCERLHAYRTEVAAAAVAFPGLFSTVLNGQTSVIALVAVTAALLALERDRPIAAGVAIGCLAFKPHWCAAAIVVFLAAREWRVAAGAVASAAAQVAVTCIAAGTGAMIGYANVMLSIQRIGDLIEPRPGDSLRAFFKVFVPSDAAALVLYLAVSAIAVALAARAWRSAAPFALRASAIVVATILISPHAFGYDLILLAPVYLLLADWLASGGCASQPEPPQPHRPRRQLRLPLGSPDRMIAWSLSALFFAPLLTAVPAAVRLQFSVTAMAVLLAQIHRVRHSWAPSALPTAAPPFREEAIWL